jgi:hypothetical protein
VDQCHGNEGEKQKSGGESGSLYRNGKTVQNVFFPLRTVADKPGIRGRALGCVIPNMQVIPANSVTYYCYIKITRNARRCRILNGRNPRRSAADAAARDPAWTRNGIQLLPAERIAAPSTFRKL